MRQRTKPKRPDPPARLELKRGREDQFARLQRELLFGRVGEELGTNYNNLIRRAARDAAALAWATPYPLLVFPVLFEEKADSAAERGQRQQRILEVSRDLLVI